MVERVVIGSDVVSAAGACLASPLPQGDPARIALASRRAGACADQLRRVSAQMLDAASARALWQGSAFEAFATSMRAHAPRLSATADRYEAYQVALAAYRAPLETAAARLPRLAREVSWQRDAVVRLRLTTDPLRDDSTSSLRRAAELVQAEHELWTTVREFTTAYDAWADAVNQCSRALLAANDRDPTRDLHGWQVVLRDLSKTGELVRPFTDLIDDPSLGHLSQALGALGDDLSILGTALSFVCPPAGTVLLTASAVVSAAKFGTDLVRMDRGEKVPVAELADDVIGMLPTARKVDEVVDDVIRLGPRLEANVTHLVPGGGLKAHEGLEGGHAIERHLQSRGFPAERLAKYPRMTEASVFVDRRLMETSLSAALEKKNEVIRRWLAGSDYEAILEARFDQPVGWVLERAAAAESSGRGIRIVLRRSGALGIGYRIHTAMVTL